MGKELGIWALGSGMRDQGDWGFRVIYGLVLGA